MNRGASVTAALLFATVTIILAKSQLGAIANRVRNIAGVTGSKE